MENEKLSALFLTIFIFVGGYFLFSKKETWTGFYYPDMTDLDKVIQGPEFSSINECREWINSQVYIHNPSGEGYDYECGKNCRFDKDYQVHICEETVR